MAPNSYSTGNPAHAGLPVYPHEDQSQTIRLVLATVPGYVPTALVALTLDESE